MSRKAYPEEKRIVGLVFAVVFYVCIYMYIMALKLCIIQKIP